MTALRYASVFEVLPSPFMIIDRDMRFVAANAAYLEVVGMSEDELIGRAVFEVFPNTGAGGERLRASIDKVLATGERDHLPYVHYPLTQADGSVVDRYWAAVHVPLRDEDGRITHILQNTVDVSAFAKTKETGRLPTVALPSVSHLIEQTREAEKSANEFRRLFQQAPGFFVVVSGPKHVITFASDGFNELVNKRALIGLEAADALPETVEQGFIGLLDRVQTEGYRHEADGAKVTLYNDPGKPPIVKFLDFVFSPIRDDAGTITGVFVSGLDRTEAVKAQRRQKLLVDELNHRVKNTMATVQSIARQTLRSTDDIEGARKAFEARLIALSTAHTILSERNWRDTEIGQLVQEELSAFDDERVRYGGPVLDVNAKTTIALTLVLHELATNAAKHGALSTPDGVLTVSWSQGANNELVLNWVERGALTTVEPTRTGFGSRLLRTVVTGELGGTLSQRFEPEGFSALIAIPASAYGARESDFA